MRAKNSIDIHNITASVKQACRSSDKLIGVGPVGIGLDGILTWIPIVGSVYTIGAGLYLVSQGARARVPGIVLMQMTALITIDAAIGAIPFAGNALDMMFCSHLWAGNLLLRSIEGTSYHDNDNDAEAMSSAMAEGKRVVIFGTRA
ncbi:DUF4112 domain-containing protein [Ancylobacter sonchi]|uniref:DUF4112 domain-containing protein n=1 Tax=Ancylobacter sonchi TaxID=1937790 RepID=UPI001BD271A5|nr:DUF4112 domain-containing protein [Ancylobacter sonchi]MBS7532323.1 DUF4112 domain-containing protein [Ancylobacter sonchi]